MGAEEEKGKRREGGINSLIQSPSPLFFAPGSQQCPMPPLFHTPFFCRDFSTAAAAALLKVTLFDRKRAFFLRWAEVIGSHSSKIPKWPKQFPAGISPPRVCQIPPGLSRVPWWCKRRRRAEICDTSLLFLLFLRVSQAPCQAAFLFAHSLSPPPTPPPTLRPEKKSAPCPPAEKTSDDV